MLITAFFSFFQFGFFKRKQKEQMEKMISDEKKDYEPLDEEANEKDALNNH